MTAVDLNSDLGEGFGVWTLGDDDALLDIVSSANIACGFHAGDPSVLRKVTELAVERGVAIGAQVGYRDLSGFGRRFIDVVPEELTNDVIYQIAALDGFARIAGSRVQYVKPHGALYNAIVTHTEQAAAVVEGVLRYDRSMPVLGLPGSEWLRQAESAGLATVHEAFVDRAYTAEGTLVSRRVTGAVLHDADEVVARALRMVREGSVVAVDGRTVGLRPRSLCVHGDTPGAVEIASRIRSGLVEAGVDIRAFVDLSGSHPHG
ncbi:MAG: LamB/YcsF family protein [Kutzneria sp.]|nr:LamB/YcsF family protein [Kutzneria sp.]